MLFLDGRRHDFNAEAVGDTGTVVDGGERQRQPQKAGLARFGQSSRDTSGGLLRVLVVFAGEVGDVVGRPAQDLVALVSVGGEDHRLGDQHGFGQ